MRQEQERRAVRVWELHASLLRLPLSISVMVQLLRRKPAAFVIYPLRPVAGIAVKKDKSHVMKANIQGIPAASTGPAKKQLTNQFLIRTVARRAAMTGNYVAIMTHRQIRIVIQALSLTRSRHVVVTPLPRMPSPSPLKS